MFRTAFSLPHFYIDYDLLFLVGKVFALDKKGVFELPYLISAIFLRWRRYFCLI